MILSKLAANPLRRHGIGPIYRISAFHLGGGQFRFHFSNHPSHNQLTTTAVKPQYIRMDIYFTRKSVLNIISKRYFKNVPNSFVNHSERYGARAIEAVVLFAVFALMIHFIIDIPYIYKHYVPKWITKPIENQVESIGEYFKWLFRKADSLAKDSIVTEDETNESSNLNQPVSDVVESSLLSNVLYYFNIRRDQEAKAGGFRDKKIIEYENRIRLYSNPDKIFRYFASIKIVYSNGDSEILMTPDDFLRSLTPGLRQPDGLGLDQYKRIDLSKNATDEIDTDLSSMLNQVMLAGKSDFKYDLKPDSIFYKLSKFGLINFSDFLFLLTVISVSKRHFEIAFRMFDLNGDGDVEYEEFEKVQNAILAQTSIGKKMGKSVHYKGISSAVSRYFFGEDLTKRLTTETFVDFQKSLQSELLTLEFERKKPDSNGRIREIDFAELLVAYANLSEKKRDRMTRRVMKKFNDANNKSVGITLEEYQNFFRFLQNIADVDVALSVYNIAGAGIDQSTLKHVAQTVAHVQLSDHLVEVVFTLFDDNEDGQLSNKEFISVMKERLRRGLAKPKDTGFLKIMYTIWKSLTSFDF